MIDTNSIQLINNEAKIEYLGVRRWQSGGVTTSFVEKLLSLGDSSLGGGLGFSTFFLFAFYLHVKISRFLGLTLCLFFYFFFDLIIYDIIK